MYAYASCTVSRSGGGGEGRDIFLSGEFSDRDFSGWEILDAESIPVEKCFKGGTYLGGILCKCGGGGS